MKDGFITALGTPLDGNGDLVRGSYQKQIEDQIAFGASALLAMGSMGNEAYIRNSVYPEVARVTTEVVRGRIPVFVGVMDNSISRVRDRIDALATLPIVGVVATTPYYLKSTQDEIASFFTRIAESSEFPLYLYDLVGVTQTQINVETARNLMLEENIKGIKSGNLDTCKQLHFDPDRGDFRVMYSNLDDFDAAFAEGLRVNLDGMFSCTALIASKLYTALKANDVDSGKSHLAEIVGLRNNFVSIGVFKGFTAAMNLLGYEGSFSPDYVISATDEEREFVRACMVEIGLL